MNVSSSSTVDDKLRIYGMKLMPNDTTGYTDLSPFVTKLLVYLHLTNTHFEYVTVDKHQMRNPKPPKGKVPFASFRGQLISDSSYIIEVLEHERLETQGLEYNLSPQDKAVSRAFKKLVEESLYWSGFVWSRWIKEEHWPITKKYYFNTLPTGLGFITYFAWRAVRDQLNAQGIGRHSPQAIEAMATEDIRTLADFLSDRSFFFELVVDGHPRPSLLVVSVYGFLACFMADGDLYPHCPVRQFFRSQANLITYCKRMGEICQQSMTATGELQGTVSE